MYFVTYTKYIVFRTVSIHQFLGCCIVSCNPKIDYLVTDQETNTMDNFESVYSLSIKHLTKATEDRSKEDCQAASVFPIPDHVICSMLTKKNHHRPLHCVELACPWLQCITKPYVYG